MARVLLVEDDPSIREVTALGLAAGGFEVLTAEDGAQALARFRGERPDLVVLDVMLPVLDGLTVCRTIRGQSAVPVVMLTARTDAIDVVAGLEAGADDYVRKPFELPELLARLRAALRRASLPQGVSTAGASVPGPSSPAGGASSAGGIQAAPGSGPGTQAALPPPIVLGPLEIDEAGHAVRRDGHEIALSHTEFRLLATLARRPGQVFTREILLDQVWGYDFLGDSRLVDVAIQRLRAKVEEDPGEPRLILTVRGAGYKLAREAPERPRSVSPPGADTAP